MCLELITQEPGNNLNVLQEAYAGLQVEMKRKENKTQLQLNSSTLVTTNFKCTVFVRALPCKTKKPRKICQIARNIQWEWGNGF